MKRAYVLIGAPRTDDGSSPWANGQWSICYLFIVLPDLTNDGELPPGAHLTTWPEFESRFGCLSPRRLWLSGRLRTILELAATGGRLRRVFVWGSFVTAKPAPRDLEALDLWLETYQPSRSFRKRGMVELELP